MKKIIDLLHDVQNLTISENTSCKQLTTFKVGGYCTAVFPSTVDAFISCIEILKKNDAKFIVIGNGSNILFDDDGYDGIVVVTTELKQLVVSENRISAECGVPLHTLCTAASGASLAGLQFAYGIPGTVGGAVFMNAGAYDGEIKDCIVDVTCFDPETSKLIKLTKEECDFSYRHSAFEDNGLIIVGADFELSYGDKNEIKREMSEIIGKRRDKQPLNYPSAGSAFKRYPGRYTAKMIDEAGLKGYSVGGAQISEKHAGFIINRKNATCRDIKELVDTVKSVIKDKEGIDIECEIRFIK
ncbi:MAG: UDP-N-acetylmuramate dehydrogenase [Clostridia bacterium]|nr:UDP-N-acetylmuramate dehydrogenase [Clostridia bacterium]